jgi:glyoxylase-like metal-dependent hydrolase (beta-lactamase superfamily II)
MLKKYVVAGSVLIVAGALGTVLLRAQASSELKAAVDKSLRAMGAENLKTLVISGDGFDGCVGQQFDANSKWWRKYYDHAYIRSIDFEARGWRLQRARGDGEMPPRGGCNAGPIAEAVQNQVVMATPANFNNQMEFTLLPVGFLKVALEKNASVKSETIKGKKYTVLSFPGDNKAPVTGYINEQGYVERVQTQIDNNVLGDIVWDAVYTDWKDFNGVKFPTHIVQHQGDPLFFELTVADVKPNAPVDLGQPPAKGKGDAKAKAAPGGRGAPAITSEDLGGGFWLVTGGYGAIIGNFKDYIIVCEGPQNDMRAEQIIAEAKRLVPGKPIRYVLNTHSHYDHVGGLRAFVAENVTIVTNQANKGFYERIFKYPHTLVPDKLSQMNPQPKTKVEYVGDKKVFTDGEHTIEMHRVQNSTHSASSMIIYLPKQKVILEGDEFNVGVAPTSPPATVNPYHSNLLANIERLHLDVDRIIPIHLPGDARKVTLAELQLMAGKKS